MSRIIAHTAALGALLLLPTACDSGAKKEASPKAAHAKKGDASKGAANKGDGKTTSHGSNPHAKAPNPHGGAAPAGPHGSAKMPPMMKKTVLGPPREVTPSGDVTPATLTGLTLAVPKEWESNPPSSSMRLAQWIMPGPGGDAELVVYRFPGGGGGVTANIDRWKGQFQPPEGKTIDDVSKLTSIDGEGGLKTTLVDVTGTYVAAVVPGGDEKHNSSEYRMFAAVVEGSGDAYYFKAVGPSKTVGLWAEPFSAMITTFKVATAAKGAAAAGDAPKPADAPKAEGAPAGADKADPAKKAAPKADPAKKAAAPK